MKFTPRVHKEVEVIVGVQGMLQRSIDQCTEQIRSGKPKRGVPQILTGLFLKTCRSIVDPTLGGVCMGW